MNYVAATSVKIGHSEHYNYKLYFFLDPHSNIPGRKPAVTLTLIQKHTRGCRCTIAFNKTKTFILCLSYINPCTQSVVYVVCQSLKWISVGLKTKLKPLPISDLFLLGCMNWIWPAYISQQNPPSCDIFISPPCSIFVISNFNPVWFLLFLCTNVD